MVWSGSSGGTGRVLVALTPSVSVGGRASGIVALTVRQTIHPRPSCLSLGDMIDETITRRAGYRDPQTYLVRHPDAGRWRRSPVHRRWRRTTIRRRRRRPPPSRRRSVEPRRAPSRPRARSRRQASSPRQSTEPTPSTEPTQSVEPTQSTEPTPTTNPCEPANNERRRRTARSSRRISASSRRRPSATATCRGWTTRSRSITRRTRPSRSPSCTRPMPARTSSTRTFRSRAPSCGRTRSSTASATRSTGRAGRGTAPPGSPATNGIGPARRCTVLFEGNVSAERDRHGRLPAVEAELLGEPARRCRGGDLRPEHPEPPDPAADATPWARPRRPPAAAGASCSCSWPP